MKQSLKVVLQNRTVTEEVFRSALTGVEALVNGRPLTHVSVDPIDPEPITPFHFILGRPNPSGPINVIDPNAIYSSKSWREAQVIVTQCWNRLVREVLPEKIERPKRLKEHKNLEIGDLVLISDKNARRGDWPTARIVEIFPGPGEVVRSTIVKTSSGTHLKRAVSSFVPFLEDS